MKMAMALKIALFTFLTAIVCTIGYMLIGISELIYVRTILWFVTYFSFSLWICSYISAWERLGKNTAVIFLSFALSAYFGFYYAYGMDPVLLPYADYVLLAFYAFVIICLVSVVVLLGRWIFGNPAKKNNVQEKNEEQVVATLPEPKVVEPTKWVCACGEDQNTGKFCSACGKEKPAETP